MQFDLSPFIDEHQFARLRAAMPSAKLYFDERTSITEEPSFGVGSNTFRAFRGIEKPSLIYRAWAAKAVKGRKFTQSASAANSQEGFEHFHTWAADSLAKYWLKESGTAISLAHKYKLLDLFLKFIARLDFDDTAIGQNLIAYGHVPIDSRVLTCLDELLSGALMANDHAMGHVRSESAYRFCQQLISLLMAEIRKPVLYFDHFAWNLGNTKNSRLRDNDSLTSDLLESNPEFQALVAKSKASPRKPFARR